MCVHTTQPACEQEFATTFRSQSLTPHTFYIFATSVRPFIMTKRKSESPANNRTLRLPSSLLLTAEKPGRSIRRVRRSGDSLLAVLFFGFLLIVGNNIANNLRQKEALKGYITQEAAIDGKKNSDNFESPQDPSPTANMANQMLRRKGVVLRYDERHLPDRFTAADQNGMAYMPASFVHASMQAPNAVFLGWPEDGKGLFEKGPRVFYLIGSKFEPEASTPSRDAPKVVDCRAYYPIDASSTERNSYIKDNPRGTSCLNVQKRFQKIFHDLYNVTNG